jgi:DNA-binding MarR family transcriptional regulator
VRDIQALNADKDYILMQEIETHQEISQRELSQKTGLSLGSVNLLLKKMIKQGMIKMETIPANRVVYMLTPVGMAEKAIKTVRYIKNQYRIIQETKIKIMQKLALYHQQYARIFFCKPENELNALVQAAVDEYLSKYPDRLVQLISYDQAAGPETLPDAKNAVILFLPGESAENDVRKQFMSSIPSVNLLDTL